MDYSKRDLMNTNNHLLRRTERQLDKVRESNVIKLEPTICVKKLSFNDEDRTINSIEEQLTKRKETKLSLLKKRGGRQ